MPDIRRTIYIEDETWDQLDKVALRRRVSPYAVIQALIEGWIKANADKPWPRQMDDN